MGLMKGVDQLSSSEHSTGADGFAFFLSPQAEDRGAGEVDDGI
jgi:hypothetical protein